MKKNTIVAGPVSRRALLHGLVAGAGLCLLPATAFAAASKSTSSAIAFYGNALIVARGSALLYRSGSQNWTALPKVSEGTILTFTTHPERPGRIVGGLDTGGVVLSVDGGKSWDVRGQGLPKAAVTAITTAATNPDTIYAAIRGDGLWQSDDAGQSWVFVMDRPWLANAERDLTALSSVDLATGMGWDLAICRNRYRCNACAGLFLPLAGCSAGRCHGCSCVRKAGNSQSTLT